MMQSLPFNNGQKREQNLSSSVYEAIKNKIINGELMPASILMERTIADEFGVSRTPVREALKRLSQEGWVDWEERRRAVVSEITISKILELFTLREMMEPFAIKKAIKEGHPQILAGQLAAAYEDMEASKDSPVDFMKHDMEFHAAIVRSMKLLSLNMMWQKISDDMMRLVMHSVYPRRDTAVILHEHKELIDALWNSDAKKALECIRGHFSVIVDMFKQKRENF
ncbi:MAG: GntR family transcriptional regulator [Synergistes jonesii]|uniref:GntR family transcriptional regulator n=1 Tax=Synergistes jonesii TaxID=2754 RepID=UPI002A7486B5|nr:GntR family transcriptional regulator [Synergistes jonesii]MDY2985461.1 GntR family transcriptional regulator [Synergistes jonesii]